MVRVIRRKSIVVRAIDRGRRRTLVSSRSSRRRLDTGTGRRHFRWGFWHRRTVRNCHRPRVRARPPDQHAKTRETLRSECGVGQQGCLWRRRACQHRRKAERQPTESFHGIPNVSVCDADPNGADQAMLTVIWNRRCAEGEVPRPPAMLASSALARHPADAGLVRHNEATPPDHRHAAALRAWASLTNQSTSATQSTETSGTASGMTGTGSGSTGMTSADHGSTATKGATDRNPNSPGKGHAKGRDKEK